MAGRKERIAEAAAWLQKQKANPSALFVAAGAVVVMFMVASLLGQFKPLDNDADGFKTILLVVLPLVWFSAMLLVIADERLCRGSESAKVMLDMACTFVGTALAGWWAYLAFGGGVFAGPHVSTSLKVSSVAVAGLAAALGVLFAAEDPLPVRREVVSEPATAPVAAVPAHEAATMERQVPRSDQNSASRAAALGLKIREWANDPQRCGSSRVRFTSMSEELCFGPEPFWPNELKEALRSAGVSVPDRLVDNRFVIDLAPLLSRATDSQTAGVNLIASSKRLSLVGEGRQEPDPPAAEGSEDD